jgi:two-component system heavy metal sensor histidine kinase CusS
MNHNKQIFATLSLTSRVTLLVSVMLTLSVLLLGWQVERSINQHFVFQDIEEIRVVVKSVKNALSTTHQSNDKHANYHQHLEQSVAGHHGIFFVVLNDQKEKIYQNDGPNFENIINGLTPVTKVATQTLINWHDQNNSYRGVLLNHITKTDEHYYIFVATLTTFHQNYLHQFSQNLWLILIISLLIIIVAVWQIVRFSHRPLFNIGKQIQGINTQQLNTRVATEKLPIELTTLVTSLNQLLERIESSYLKLSYFSSDIAHELRTPVTNLMTQTQVSLNKARDIDAYREVLYSNLEEYERMAKMISDMLLLAKAENGLLATDRIKLNILNEVLALNEYFEMAASEQKINLSVINKLTSSNKLFISADQAMLRRALSNLYSNALRYTPNGNTITTTISQQFNEIFIEIKNPGEQIPSAQLAHIFDRFYRGDSSRKRTTEGVGLGLAITQAIIKFHQGEISVISTKQATCFTVKLPLV